jgi:hypothetical protein
MTPSVAASVWIMACSRPGVAWDDGRWQLGTKAQPWSVLKGAYERLHGTETSPQKRS